MGPKSSDYLLYKRRGHIEIHTEIHRKESHADSSKDWSDMDTSKECQRLLRAKTRQEEARKGFIGSMAGPTP